MYKQFLNKKMHDLSIHRTYTNAYFRKFEIIHHKSLEIFSKYFNFLIHTKKLNTNSLIFDETHRDESDSSNFGLDFFSRRKCKDWHAEPHFFGGDKKGTKRSPTLMFFMIDKLGWSISPFFYDKHVLYLSHLSVHFFYGNWFFFNQFLALILKIPWIFFSLFPLLLYFITYAFSIERIQHRKNTLNSRLKSNETWIITK